MSMDAAGAMVLVERRYLLQADARASAGAAEMLGAMLEDAGWCKWCAQLLDHHEEECSDPSES